MGERRHSTTSIILAVVVIGVFGYALLAVLFSLINGGQ